MSQKPSAKWISNQKKSIIFGLLERPIITWNEFMFNTYHLTHTLATALYYQRMNGHPSNYYSIDWRLTSYMNATVRQRWKNVAGEPHSVRTCFTLENTFFLCKFRDIFPSLNNIICTWTAGKLNKKMEACETLILWRKNLPTQKKENSMQKHTYSFISHNERVNIWFMNSLPLWNQLLSFYYWWRFFWENKKKGIRWIYLRYWDICWEWIKNDTKFLKHKIDRTLRYFSVS